jgi:hypothetical protein
VNRLVRDRPELVHALLDTGRGLRLAQEELDAGRLKELGVERRQRVAAAVAAAAAIGDSTGRPPGPAVLEEIGATCTAAVLDEASGGAVASGRLVRPLPADGLEGAPVGDLVALPEAPAVLPAVAPRPGRRTGRPVEPARADPVREDRVAAAARRDAERAVEDAERLRDRARRAELQAGEDLSDADRRRDEAEAHVADLRSRISDLQRRLDAAEDDLRTLEREVRDRRSGERAARRAADDAADELTRARSRLDALR